jgi:hypothetical protein
MEREIHYAARGLLPCRAKRLGIVSASSESVARGEAVFSVIALRTRPSGSARMRKLAGNSMFLRIRGRKKPWAKQLDELPLCWLELFLKLPAQLRACRCDCD